MTGEQAGSGSPRRDRDVVQLVAELAARAAREGFTVAAAESLTGGQLCAALAAGEESGEWFRGGVVAYHPSVKFDLLDVPVGPVVTARTAEAMADAVLRDMGSTVAVAMTGAGGPGPEEGEPEGTVYIALAAADAPARARRFEFEGEPATVLQETVVTALTMLLDR